MAPPVLAALLLSLLPLADGLNSRAFKRSASGIPVEVRELVNNPDVVKAIPDSYMFVFKPDTSQVDLEAMHKSFGAKVKIRNVQKRSIDGRLLSDKVEACSINSWHAMRVECEPDVVRELAENPHVKAIEANSVFEIPEMPSADPILKRQTERDVPCKPERRNKLTVQASGNPCMICVLDTGVNSHSEFGNRLLKGKNFTKDPTTNDTNGHGTHVAALAAGATISEAPNCMILPIKILGGDGKGDVMDIARGLKFCRDTMTAMNMTSATANLSMGGQRSLCVNAAIDEVAKAGVVPVTAAGNEHMDARTASPASAAASIAVGAVNSNNTIASFSDFGPKVQIFADGVDVCSASNKNPDSFRAISGTSQACPQVAAQVAIKLSQDKSRSPPNSIDILASIQEDARKAGSKVEPKADGNLGIAGAEPFVLASLNAI